MEKSCTNNFLPPFGQAKPFATFEPAPGQGWRPSDLYTRGETDLDAPRLPSIQHTGALDVPAELTTIPDAAELVNADRITLLARQYAQKSLGQGLTGEEIARLEITTEKVIHTMPSVTQKDFATLESIMREIEEIGEVDKELRKDLGLE